MTIIKSFNEIVLTDIFEKVQFLGKVRTNGTSVDEKEIKLN